jgi:ABC-type sugar transport system ATPase subunit
VPSDQRIPPTVRIFPWCKGCAHIPRTHNIHQAYAVSDHIVAQNAGVKVLDTDKADVTPEMLTEAVIGEPLAQVTSHSLAASVANGNSEN